MNEVEMDDILTWWSLKANSPHDTKEYKKFYQDKLDKVLKLVDELNKKKLDFNAKSIV